MTPRHTGLARANVEDTKPWFACVDGDGLAACRNNASCDRMPSLRGKPNNIGQMIDKPADTDSVEDLCR